MDAAEHARFEAVTAGMDLADHGEGIASPFRSIQEGGDTTFFQTDGDDVIGIRADEQGATLSGVDQFGQQIDKLRKGQIVFH